MDDDNDIRFRFDTGVWLAQRNAPGNTAWYWSDHYNGMVCFDANYHALRARVAGPDLFGNRVVWADSEADALRLWHAEQVTS